MKQNSGVKLFVFSSMFLISFAQDYCRITCDGEIHTMCLFSGQSSNCGYLMYSDRKKLRKEMLELHNDFRNKFANQEFENQKDKGFPKAANMNQLYWDGELEEIAKRWVEQCEFKHDECRNVDRFHVGQNLGYQAITQGNTPRSSAVTFENWVTEMKDADLSLRENYRAVAGPLIGHFTQAAWAETKFVGCAEVTYLVDDMTRRYIACDYGPAGNVLGKPMYEEGTPCSKCQPDMYCGTKFKYLCYSALEEEKSLKYGRQSFGGAQGTRVKTFKERIIITFITLLVTLHSCSRNYVQ